MSFLLWLLETQLVAVCFSPFEQVLFWLAFALAFLGVFRISELVALSRQWEGGSTTRRGIALWRHTV